MVSLGFCLFVFIRNILVTVKARPGRHQSNRTVGGRISRTYSQPHSHFPGLVLKVCAHLKYPSTLPVPKLTHFSRPRPTVLFHQVLPTSTAVISPSGLLQAGPSSCARCPAQSFLHAHFLTTDGSLPERQEPNLLSLHCKLPEASPTQTLGTPASPQGLTQSASASGQKLGEVTPVHGGIYRLASLPWAEAG